MKRIITALTDMFNDLQIEVLDDNGAQSKMYRVPITFGPVNKYQYLRDEDGQMKKYYLQLPRLALTLDGFTYAQERATGVNDHRNFFDGNLDLGSLDEFFDDIHPTPWDLNFTLHIRTERMDQFSQIIENILPYFNPSLYLRIKEFDFLNIERNLQVRIEGLNPEFTTEQPEDEKREVNGTINFVVESWMYRPITNQKIIKEIQTRYFTTHHSSTSATNTLQEQYNTSGFTSVSAVPDATTYDFSGTFETKILDTSGVGIFAVMAESTS